MFYNSVSNLFLRVVKNLERLTNQHEHLEAELTATQSALAASRAKENERLADIASLTRQLEQAHSERQAGSKRIEDLELEAVQRRESEATWRRKCHDAERENGACVCVLCIVCCVVVFCDAVKLFPIRFSVLFVRSVMFLSSGIDRIVVFSYICVCVCLYRVT